MMTLGIALFVVAAIISLIGGAMFTSAAFRVSTKWGLLVVFVPFAAFVFLFKYWQEARKGFLINLAGGALMAVAAVIVFVGMAANVGSQMMEQAALEMQAQTEAQQPMTDPFSQMASQTQFAEEVPPEHLSQPDFDATLDDLGPEPASDPEQAPERSLEPRRLEALVAAEDIGRDLSSPSYAGAEIPFDRAREFIGRDLIFVRHRGGSIRGELLAVADASFQIKREVSGGTVVYSIERDTVEKLRAD